MRRAGEALAARGAKANAALNDARKRARDKPRRNLNVTAGSSTVWSRTGIWARVTTWTGRSTKPRSAWKPRRPGRSVLEESGRPGFAWKLGDAVRAVEEAEKRLSDALKAVAGIEGELSAFGSALASARSLPSLLARFGDGVDIYGPGILPDFRSRRDQVTQRSRELAAENDRFRPDHRGDRRARAPSSAG